MTDGHASAALEMPLQFGCDGTTLLGILHSATHRASGLGVIVVVGGPQYRVGSHRQFVIMARAFAAAGHAVLRFDYRGMGESDGEPRTFETVDADIRAAVDALLVAAPGLRGVVLWGLCDAASAVLMYCVHDPRVAGVVLANPWVRTPSGEARTYLRHYYLRRLMQAAFWRKALTGGFKLGKSARELTAAVRSASGGPGASAAVSFLERMLDSLRAFDKPIGVLLSERDLTAQEFADRCRDYDSWEHALRKQNVVVTELAGADHTFSAREALERAVAATLAVLGGIRLR
jgi:exosortase A-associated hydrolase 1